MANGQIEVNLPYVNQGYNVRIFANADFEQSVSIDGRTFEGSGKGKLIGTTSFSGGKVKIKCMNRHPKEGWRNSKVAWRGLVQGPYPYYWAGSEDSPEERSAIDFNDSLVYFYFLP